MNRWGRIVDIINENPYTNIELKTIQRKLCNVLEKSVPATGSKDMIKNTIYDILRLLRIKADANGDMVYLNSLRCILHSKHFTPDDLNRLLNEEGLLYKYIPDDGLTDEGVFVAKDKPSADYDNKKYDKIFISHSSLDKKIVKAFVELLEDIKLGADEIFCSSLAEYGIPLGENIADAIKTEFSDKRILVIFMLSDNYYSSAMCLNEMGAAWVLKKDYRSVLLPGYEYKSIKGAIDAGKIGIKLDDDKSEVQNRLIELRNQIQEGFNLQKLDERTWNRKQAGFMKKVKHTNKIKPREKA